MNYEFNREFYSLYKDNKRRIAVLRGINANMLAEMFKSGERHYIITDKDRPLPNDAKLVYIDYKYMTNEIDLYFESELFKEVDDGELPEVLDSIIVHAISCTDCPIVRKIGREY